MGENKKKIPVQVPPIQASTQTPVQPDDLKVADKPPIMKKLPMKNTKGTIVTVLVSLLVVLAGIGTGWLISGRPVTQSTQGTSEEISGVGGDQTEAGIADEETFREKFRNAKNEGGG